jgi:hypothetical protein
MKTVFIPNIIIPSLGPTTSLISSILSVNNDENIKSDFVFINEKGYTKCLEYCLKHNLSFNYGPLTNKHTAYELFKKYNFSTVLTIKPLCLSDVESFEADNIFIKPVIGCNSNNFFDINPTLLSQAYYTPINKQSILDILGVESSNFWETQQNINGGFIFQKYADVYENSQINFYVQYGCINGNGTVFFCNPTLSSKIKINNIYCSLSSYSSENLSDEILNIQSMIQNLVSGENIKNCLFNMQFLIVNGAYMPIDFNFRLGYQDIYINDQFPELNWGRSLIEYAYDIIDDTPVRPQISTAMNLKRIDKLIAHGQTKQEALDNLQNLINNT